MAFYDENDLWEMGFKHVGENVLVSDKVSLYGVERISIGDNSRIDDFCVLSAGPGGITIGRNVHVACFCSLIGKEEIVLSDFSGLSSRVSVYSSSDDYTGKSLTNPTVPNEFKRVHNARVFLGRHVIVGSGSVILPGVTLNEGAAVGALSLVNKDCEEFSVYLGVPAKRLMGRSKKLLEMEKQYLGDG